MSKDSDMAVMKSPSQQISSIFYFIYNAPPPLHYLLESLLYTVISIIAN
jgi:hypothetical protein